MDKFGKYLVLFFVMVLHLPVAAENNAKNYTFQQYFANMRQCLSSDSVEKCLPSKLGITVAKPGSNYTREELVTLVLNDKILKEHLASCFSESAQIILNSGDSKLFRSNDFACQATKIDETWQLAQFYNFFSRE